MKKCSKCGSNETYIKKNGKPDWRYDKDDNLICKKCSLKQYYLKNHEHAQQYRKQYYLEHRELFRQYYLDNHEYYLQYYRQWYQDNHEYANLYRKITQDRATSLLRDRRNLRSGKWIP